jgi:hypothetical protein
VWTAEQPVDIANDFYQAEQAWSAFARCKSYSSLLRRFLGSGHRRGR